eukprot:CAMPEP_0114990940 /NCGR_PEP_ID=MMETSP0216-20121206/11083_1 /TAXON_ID=223996 /ORGANISM="Protocruzia adherens, Strain Boccale" /LENGTH=658 /DNA_ID=CAMNT_0002354187 /DNA_START=27 /DNA_END=2004 /DNA_ORIENTATION=-
MEGKVQISQKKFRDLVPQKGNGVTWASDPSVELPLWISHSGPGSEVPFTLLEGFKKTVLKNPAGISLGIKRAGRWVLWTWRKYYLECRAFAVSLLALGIMAGMIPVATYSGYSLETTQYVASHSDAEIIVVDNLAQAKKYNKIWDQLPKLKKMIVYNETNKNNQKELRRMENVVLWEEFLKLGEPTNKMRMESLKRELTGRKEAITPGKCVTIVYTSGTIGEPKGAMLSHDNVTWHITSQVKKMLLNRDTTVDDKVVSYLPLSHIAAQTSDIFAPILLMYTVFFASSKSLSQSLLPCLQEVQPTIFWSVPAIWERLEERLKKEIAKSNFLYRTLVGWSTDLGERATRAQSEGGAPPRGYSLASMLVYNRSKSSIGLDNVEIFLSGAAPISTHTVEFFSGLNIPLSNSYGLTETTGPHTSNIAHIPSRSRHGSVGRAFAGCDVKIIDQDATGEGEICLKGRNIFLGYLGDDEANEETFTEDRYLKTGDLGRLDNDGFLFITGRKKEIIVGVNGENIAPLKLEHAIQSQSSLISHVLIIGDGRRYLTALVTLKSELDSDGQPTDKLTEESREILKQINSKASNVSAAAVCKYVRDEIQRCIEDCNRQSTTRELHVKKFTLLPRDFSIKTGELTPTLKLKRRIIHKMYDGLINSMYAEAKL